MMKRLPRADKFLCVQLTTDEAAQAVRAGRSYQARARKDGAKDKHGLRGGDRGITRLGMLGERAVAKAFDIPWKGTPGDCKAFDVGGFIEVRTSKMDYPSLLIRKNDKNRCPYVSVSARAELWFKLQGWMWGVEAKKERWWKDPTPGKNRPPAYFVPFRDLRPVSSLWMYIGDLWADKEGVWHRRQFGDFQTYETRVEEANARAPRV